MTMRAISRMRRVPSCTGWAVLVAVGVVCSTVASQEWTETAAASAPGGLLTWAVVSGDSGRADPGPPKDDPSKIMGPPSCVECHESQVRAWMKSRHAKSDETLMSAAADNYARKLHIAPERLLKDSICAGCHATVQTDADGNLHAIAGVSCERCHGPSGGRAGWLKPHAVFGPEGTKPDEETPAHRKQRLALCDQRGMIRPADAYKLAKRCFHCHIVPDESLVNAGHKAGSAGFELVSWIAGEVRHNFHLDPQINAPAPTLWMKHTGRTAAERKRVLFVLGVFADLETSLRNRSRATTNTYASQMGARVGALQAKLAQVNAASATPQTQAAAQIAGRVFARLFVIQNGDDEFFAKAADGVAQAAQAFSEQHDGSRLMALDPLIASQKPEGTAYQP